MPIEYTIVIVCFKTVLDKLLGRLSRQHNIKIKTRKGAERTVFKSAHAIIISVMTLSLLNLSTGHFPVLACLAGTWSK